MWPESRRSHRWHESCSCVEMIEDCAARPAAPLAVYANYCEVGHNAFEFLLDFGQFRPETTTVHVHSRIVSGPVQAKLFARLLSDAVTSFEATHGAIPELADDDALGGLIGAVPEFEHRAIRARGRPLSPVASAGLANTIPDTTSAAAPHSKR